MGRRKQFEYGVAIKGPTAIAQRPTNFAPGFAFVDWDVTTSAGKAAAPGLGAEPAEPEPVALEPD